MRDFDGVPPMGWKEMAGMLLIIPLLMLWPVLFSLALGAAPLLVIALIICGLMFWGSRH